MAVRTSRTTNPRPSEGLTRRDAPSSSTTPSGHPDILRKLLPRDIEVAESNTLLPLDQITKTLFDDELKQVARAVPLRAREFATGRACARSALGALGIGPCELLSDPHRAPRWPTGIVGSITHCRGMYAAAVASASELSHLGIDAEPNDHLPKDILPTVALDAEREWLNGFTDVAAGRLLFSAKESVFKATFPADQVWRGFRDVEVILSADGTFKARATQTPPLPSLIGRWAATSRLLVTAAYSRHRGLDRTDRPPPPQTRVTAPIRSHPRVGGEP